MAAGDRSKRIRSNVQRVLQNRGETLEAGLANAIFESGDRIIRRIAEDALCLENTFEIDTTDGEELYSLPEDFIAERILIQTGSSVELKKISMDELRRLKLSAQSLDQSDTTSGDLFFYYLWNNEIGILLGNGSAPGSSVTVTMYYWRYPTEELSNTRDPVLRPQWDDVIFKGIVAEMTRDQMWERQFEAGLMTAKLNERSRQGEVRQVEVNTSYD